MNHGATVRIVAESGHPSCDVVGAASRRRVAELRDPVAIEDDGLARYACAALDVDDGDVPDDDGRARRLSRNYQSADGERNEKDADRNEKPHRASQATGGT